MTADPTVQRTTTLRPCATPTPTPRSPRKQRKPHGWDQAVVLHNNNNNSKTGRWWFVPPMSA
eukprot:CAMPEP_0201141016 /NCGR_PEP_ID=MMETSP0851-20130426/2608_1 /ASSEMBLY_ACC=CAM_ASM_000631 /TAXON_ID=183588 /ORGANISM="Pseudo-nitzschia fraudulenta, Strain WWA7" /LENGTH=61 /DNA_ID=CAMNT_0047413875 /DNA_START=68 /DNA_END=253 /DNA_ORIENTATION=+